ncbi:hypothetical protein EDB83DRAFT_401332 [Lactarius deliciosus]|nr:hypothetical protein EDB83DRAFT_401332 [Lactarius deliciosus]
MFLSSHPLLRLSPARVPQHREFQEEALKSPDRPDGQRIVSGSSDRTIRVWTATTGDTEAGPFTGHTSSVTSVAFSPPDGQRIVSYSHDWTIHVLNTVTVAWPFGPKPAISFCESTPYLGHRHQLLIRFVSPHSLLPLSTFSSLNLSCPCLSRHRHTPLDRSHLTGKGQVHPEVLQLASSVPSTFHPSFFRHLHCTAHLFTLGRSTSRRRLKPVLLLDISSLRSLPRAHARPLFL